MNRPEDEFWGSRLGKIMTLIDIDNDYNRMQTAEVNQEAYTSKYFGGEVEEIHSMKEIEGFV